jgi:hypothetical protein
VSKCLQILLFARHSHIAEIKEESLSKNFKINLELTLFVIMSFEFCLQHEKGTPQASREPKILDVQLKYKF